MTDFVSSLFRFVLRLVLGLMAAVFAVSLLAAALVVLAFGLLRALITGQKPAMAFSRFRGYAPQDLWTRKADPAGEVVDVQVREVNDVGDSQHASSDTPASTTRRSASIGDATDVADKNAARPTDSAS